MRLPRPAPEERRWWWIGGTLIAAFTALVVWIGLDMSLGRVTWDVLGYRVVDDATVTVDVQVHRPDGRAVTCELRAIAMNFSTVGTVSHDLPASATPGTSDVITDRVTIRTSSRAVTGTVDHCD